MTQRLRLWVESAVDRPNFGTGLWPRTKVHLRHPFCNTALARQGVSPTQLLHGPATAPVLADHHSFERHIVFAWPSFFLVRSVLHEVRFCVNPDQDESVIRNEWRWTGLTGLRRFARNDRGGMPLTPGPSPKERGGMPCCDSLTRPEKGLQVLVDVRR